MNTRVCADPLDIRSLSIADEGRVFVISEDMVRAYHGGTAVFGLTVAFRMLQKAAELFSTDDEVWDRSDLYIVSAHPGPGVRDAIECVTRVVSRGRFEVTDSHQMCHADMRFEWRVRYGRQTLSIGLKEAYIPNRLLELLRLKVSGEATADDLQALMVLKQDLSHTLWQHDMAELFDCCLEETI